MPARAQFGLILAASFVLCLIAPAGLRAQSRTPTLEQIMANPDWVARSPTNIAWAWDGKTVLFDQKRAGSRISDRFRIPAIGGEPRLITDNELPFISSRNGTFSQNRSRKAFTRSGDIFIRDMQTGSLTQLTRTSANESSPFFMVDGSVAFRRDGSWIIRNAEMGIEQQAADIRTIDDPDEERKEKQDEDRDYLTEQQHRLFAIVRDREQRTDEREARDEAQAAADPTRVPGPFYLGEGWRVHARALSPSGTWMALTVSKDPGRAERDEMPAYVNEDGYVSSSSVRAKVGIEKRRSDEVVLIDLARERVFWMDASGLPKITEDPLAWLKEQNEQDDAVNAENSENSENSDAESLGNESEDSAESGGTVSATEADAEPTADEEETQEPRAFTVEDVEWSRDGTGVFFVLHSNDNKDRWIATADLQSLAKTEETDRESDKPMLTAIHHLHDEAWINWRYNEAGWTRDSSAVWFLSEETGYSHLNRWDRATGRTVALTAGSYTVQNVVEAADGRLYFRMNRYSGTYKIGRALPNDESQMPTPSSPFQAARMPEEITDLSGTVDSFVLSPDESHVAFLHSTAMNPPEVYVQSLAAGAAPIRLTDTDTDLYRSFDWIEPRFVQVPSSHVDAAIPCRVYDDPSVPAPSDRGKPVVLFSHGAGYTQHVYNGWSYYFREHMFHTLLCREGYIVIAPDFRASAGYGRDWRTAIYRNMGRPELEDFDDCLDWLGENYNADLGHTGIYGGSYGGFMTLMAMFLRPDVYDCGASLRPVTDWAHYNHSYTSNILNTPDIDPEAYERSSPIEHAEHLKGALLMCHGMLDDNVVAQDTIRLAQRLIELEKEHWEMALYPVEPHGFREPSGWLDEYRRIFKLFETHLKQQ